MFDPKINRQTLSAEDAENLEFDVGNWVAVDGPKIVGHNRWSVLYETVYSHTPSNTHWLIREERGATEYQEVDHPLTAVRVIPEQRMTTVYDSYEEALA
jgi:hypothetical protein